MKKLSQKEIKSIERLRVAFDKLPKTLIVYVVDADVVVCKMGVSNYDICEEIGRVYPTNSLNDVHDDMDFGRE